MPPFADNTFQKNTVEVFKTNVTDVARSGLIVQHLLGHFPSAQINFDLEDCDKILRVEAATICNATVIQLMNGLGYFCEVLAGD